MSLLSHNAVPKRRLTSQTIRNLVEKNVVNDLVINKLDVITARLVWRTSSRQDDERAKNLISNKRNSCDAIVASINGVVFFYSCVSVIEHRKRKRVSEDETSDEKNTFPCINYWIVCQKLIREREQVIFAKLMDSGLDISDVKPIRARKKVNGFHDLSVSVLVNVNDKTYDLYVFLSYFRPILKIP